MSRGPRRRVDVGNGPSQTLPAIDHSLCGRLLPPRARQPRGRYPPNAESDSKTPAVCSGVRGRRYRCPAAKWLGHARIRPARRPGTISADRVMRHLVRIALFSTVLVAQPRAAVEYRCSAEDIEKFALECSSDRPCPVYLDLSAADSGSGRIFGTGNLHTQSATLYSVL